MSILYINIYSFLQSLPKRLYIYVFIYEITKQLFNIVSFRISNFRAFGPKVVELCVVEKCNFGGVWGGRLPGWSLDREYGYPFALCNVTF
jgi:hypothetical protein